MPPITLDRAVSQNQLLGQQIAALSIAVERVRVLMHPGVYPLGQRPGEKT
jgi:hypothetical protein